MFKLIELKIFDHEYFGELSTKFVNEGEEKNGPYTTLLIGPNGTGKSQILAIILEIFNYLAACKLKHKLYHKFGFSFTLKYRIDNNEIIVKYEKNKASASVDDVPTEISKISIPKKFLASAINLTDRFPNLTSGSKLRNNHYEYLGIRSTSNNAFTSNHIKGIVDNLSEALMQD